MLTFLKSLTNSRTRVTAFKICTAVGGFPFNRYHLGVVDYHSLRQNVLIF